MLKPPLIHISTGILVKVWQAAAQKKISSSFPLTRHVYFRKVITLVINHVYGEGRAWERLQQIYRELTSLSFAATLNIKALRQGAETLERIQTTLG